MRRAIAIVLVLVMLLPAEARTPVAGVEIPITDIESLMIGQAENKEAGTGCTVLICRDGMRAGLDVRGGGPASRESQLLNPLTSAQFLHAVVLSGGSAYGLGAAPHLKVLTIRMETTAPGVGRLSERLPEWTTP